MADNFDRNLKTETSLKARPFYFGRALQLSVKI